MTTIDLTIVIPDAIAIRVRDGFCVAHGYQSTLPNPESAEAYIARTGGSTGYSLTIPNPEGKLDFIKRKLREFIKDSYGK